MCREQLLCRNVKRFRGGLVYKAHGFGITTLGSRVIKKKRRRTTEGRWGCGQEWTRGGGGVGPVTRWGTPMFCNVLGSSQGRGVGASVSCTGRVSHGKPTLEATQGQMHGFFS